MLWRAFDKTVRRKPLAFAADAVYGNSIDLELEVVAKKGVERQALLLMFVNVLVVAFTPVMVRRDCSSFKRKYACTDTRGSVRRVSGFVLTCNPEVKCGVEGCVPPMCQICWLPWTLLDLLSVSRSPPGFENFPDADFWTANISGLPAQACAISGCLPPSLRDMLNSEPLPQTRRSRVEYR